MSQADQQSGQTQVVFQPKGEGGLRRWLVERYPVGPLLDWGRGKYVPKHAYTMWYTLGGMLLFMLGLQIVTGVLLAFYYRPTEESAYKSILNICGVIPFGWVVRSLHAWTANVMITLGFAHLFSVWLLRAFRKPRELTWVTGILIFGLLLAFGFSGYLLPWDELAFFATKVGTKIAGSVPIVGYRLMHFLRGGEDVSGDTIGRFFAFHTCVIPLLACGLAGIHVLFVQIQGVSVPPSVEAKGADCPRIPFFPDFLLHEIRAWLLLFGVLLTLAVAFPWGIGKQAMPLAPAPAGIRPEWYFLSMCQVFKLLPTRILGIEGEVVGTIVFVVACGLLVALPFVSRRAAAQRRVSVSTVLAIVTMLFLAGFTLIGYVTSEREKQATTRPLVAEKPVKSEEAALDKSLEQTRARIHKERASFLLYTAGVWGCIALLVMSIQIRLAHAERMRKMGLGG